MYRCVSFRVLSRGSKNRFPLVLWGEKKSLDENRWASRRWFHRSGVFSSAWENGKGPLLGGNVAQVPEWRRAPWDLNKPQIEFGKYVPINQRISEVELVSSKEGAPTMRRSPWENAISHYTNPQQSSWTTDLLAAKKFALLMVLLFGSASAVWWLKYWIGDPVPYSNRKRGLLIPKPIEIFYGDIAFENILMENFDSLVDEDDPRSQEIREIGMKLVKANQLDHFQWRFQLVESEFVNAQVLPGGKCIVFSGILNILENEDDIASVLAHEIGHVVARHGAESMTRYSVLGGLYLIFQPILRLTGFKETVLGFLLEISFYLPMSRANEFEADLIGLYLMKNAGFDLQSASRVMKRLIELGSDTGSFLSTHPSGYDRLERIKEIAKVIEGQSELGVEEPLLSSPIE